MCSFCRPQTHPIIAPQSRPVLEKEADSVVVILDPDSGAPHCSGFSVKDYDGIAVLVTAAHCVTRKIDPFDPSPNAARSVKTDDEVVYVTRSMWELTASQRRSALVTDVDLARDWAVLEGKPFEVPMPLERATPCYDCRYNRESVHAISSVYDWTRHEGNILRVTYSGIGSNFYESDLDIDFGWSGSPVINAEGKVMGIVIQCHDEDVEGIDHPYKVCKPGWSMVTSLP